MYEHNGVGGTSITYMLVMWLKVPLFKRPDTINKAPHALAGMGMGTEAKAVGRSVHPCHRD